MSAGRLDFVIPGDLGALTGGYAYARRILAGLEARGWSVRVHSLDGCFPHPDADGLCRAEETLERIPTGGRVVVDGLALGAIPEIAERHARRLDLVALVHHPLHLETGLHPDERRRLHRSEERSLATVRRVITTSRTTAEAVASFGVSPDRIRVVLPGTDAAPLASGSQGASLRLLCVATLTPRKGHLVLLEALSRLRHLPWQLACVGSPGRDPEHAERILAAIARHGLEGRARLSGELSDAGLAQHYQAADVFVLASFHEGYGMALAEALARGLPVVSTTAGAIPETVPAGAGILVPPGDASSLAGALRRVIEDSELRESLRAAAGRARAALPSWAAACDAFVAALGRSPGPP